MHPHLPILTPRFLNPTGTFTAPPQYISIDTRSEPSMDCNDFLDRYSDYDDSLLSPRDLSEFRAHLALCTSCARYDRVLRKGRMLARQLPAPEPDPERLPRLQARLGASRARRARRGMALPPLATAALAAVTILLVSTSALALFEGSASRAAGGVAGGVAAAPVSAPWRTVASTGVPVAMEGGSVLLPAVSGRSPRAWAAERVDHRLASSYSPLVTGPPAYRAVRVYSQVPGTSNRRTLD